MRAGKKDLVSPSLPFFRVLPSGGGTPLSFVLSEGNAHGIEHRDGNKHGGGAKGRRLRPFERRPAARLLSEASPRAGA
jgi:hypothetical protein